MLTRTTLLAALFTAAIAGGALSQTGPVFDDSGYHPQLLAPGTAEYDLAVKRQLPKVRTPVAADQLSEALRACELIPALSAATHVKCELAAYQIAAKPSAVEETLRARRLNRN